jgi:phosphoglycerate dehydrogenase-like enzyme
MLRMSSARLTGSFASLTALACLAAPETGFTQQPRAAEMIAELGLRESGQPVRERKDWRTPKKIVVIGGGSQAGSPYDALKLEAPKAEIVLVPDTAALARAAVDADVIVGLTSLGNICEPEVINPAKQLRWVFSLSAGVERCVAVPAIKDRGLLVTNLRALEGATIAEHSIAMAMALARAFPVFDDLKNQGVWGRGLATGARLQVLNEKTMLVVGLGGIGAEVAKRAHGIGMKVTATRNSSRTGPDYVSYVGLPDELFKLARDADVIVNTAPLTSETIGLFDAKFFANMKPSAYFINVARGRAVVTDDLVAALNEGRIAGAGLDVTEPEPLPAGHPLWKAPNLILTPHISSGSDLPRETRWNFIRENMRRYVAGEKVLSEVDMEREY